MCDRDNNKVLSMAAAGEQNWPKDVGIVNMEIYFPPQ